MLLLLFVILAAVAIVVGTAIAVTLAIAAMFYIEAFGPGIIWLTTLLLTLASGWLSAQPARKFFVWTAASMFWFFLIATCLSSMYFLAIFERAYGPWALGGAVIAIFAVAALIGGINERRRQKK